MYKKVIRLESRTVLRVLDEDESRAIKATSTADEMNGCFLISSIGSNQRVGVEMITRQENPNEKLEWMRVTFADQNPINCKSPWEIGKNLRHESKGLLSKLNQILKKTKSANLDFDSVILNN